MFHLKYLFYFILLHFIIAAPQINLYYTDGVSESDYALQHNCLRIPPNEEDGGYFRQIMSYCMSELPSKFNIEKNDFFSKSTFAELSKQNITSQQLYLWSAPIDLIEHYQFYLNQLSTTNDLSLSKEIFYNCTMPRFGPMCQYQLHYHYSNNLSLYEIINDFYRTYQYNQTTFTCYTHLICNRGPYPSCLDWIEICDGKVDCLDGGFDEEHCWQLEINQCANDEYRCRNGQCIPQSFYKDRDIPTDCLDNSDEPLSQMARSAICKSNNGPSFLCEDTAYHRPMWAICYGGKNKYLMEIRPYLLMKTMYSTKDSSISENCWSVFKCLINFEDSHYSSYDELCEYNASIEIFQKACPDMLYFLNVPEIFGNIYFTYRKSDLHYWNSSSTALFYICYDKSQYDDVFINITNIFFNNMTCIYPESFLSSCFFQNDQVETLYSNSIYELYKLLNRYRLIFNYTSEICNRPNMYQCARSSKCISIYRLMDTIDDCPHMDDENMAAISNLDRIEHFKKTHFKCKISDTYIHQSLVNDQNCDCPTIDYMWCEDEYVDIVYLQANIVFQHICDGFIDLLPIIITERNETDETECEQWQCNNIYTNCNGVWNCPNGADESGCISHSILNCSSKEHLCLSSDTNQFICLPIEKANDGNVDCFGATDEPTLCGTKIQSIGIATIYDEDFYCMNQSSQLCIRSHQLCDGYSDCEHEDDEQFCTANQTTEQGHGIYVQFSDDFISKVKQFLYDYRVPARKWGIIPFKLDGMIKSIEDRAKNIENTMFSSSSIIEVPDQYQPRCHRGLDLRVWLNNSSTKDTCLCPPSFYGDQCQYQNQRISLTLKFRALSGSWQTLFAIVISLIDDSDQRIIHSYEQFTYLSVRDCKIKFNSYLLYSTRPKDPTKNYAIQIDVYEKISLTYRGSVLLPVTFSFLPVHRLAFIVDIPRSDDKTQSCSNDKCVHGKCIKYSNNRENLTFCQCNQGWSGRYCTIQYTCICAFDSLCIGVSASNRSICVCPMNKFGPRCFLTDTICQTNNNSACRNGGKCISNVDYMGSNQDFECICPKGFTGDRCEISDNELILSFGKDIVLPQSIFIHFIEIMHTPLSMDYIARATTFRTIPVRLDSVTIYWSQPFHLVFTEFFNKTYYLTVVQGTFNQSSRVIKMINPSDHCPHIRELFNESFVQWHLIRRIKYYHLPCQNQSLNLSCFYDDVHFCLCYQFQQQRLANCFNFNHNMTFDCLGQNECENGAQCLQDTLNCPTKSLCICPPCFYGKLCQFSTSRFGLSLDAILGYHIVPDVSLAQQPLIIKISLALTIILMVTGLINGILSMITFKSKIVRDVGCGLYLLGSSITTLLTMVMFFLKFLILLLAQMAIISNKSFLQAQCHSIDFLVRVCLCMDQWLNACVAAERAFTIIKGPGFVKKKSKQAAKFVIVILLIVIVGTCIHDSIYRRLIEERNDDDDDVKRIWCIVTYPSSLEIYNYIIHIFHLFGPLIINLISSIILITKKSRQKAIFHKQQSYKEILREQFREHRHLLTAPIVLVILAIPRLIIIFVSKCMKSANDSWLFLIGYFISFIPPTLTFVVFIMPSKLYMKEFHKIFARYRTIIRRHLHFIS